MLYMSLINPDEMNHEKKGGFDVERGTLFCIARTVKSLYPDSYTEFKAEHARFPPKKQATRPTSPPSSLPSAHWDRSKKSSPDVRLELTALRLKVSRANQLCQPGMKKAEPRFSSLGKERR
jgi:hypothetical protein